MRVTPCKNGVRISDVQDFSLEKTLECGQCFRFFKNSGGAYTGVADGRCICAESTDDGVFLSCTEAEFESFWQNYFDLDRSYAEILDCMAQNPFLAAAADYGRGIRVLRQQPWETLASFILSQCNNIPRIRGMVDKLCALCGDPIPFSPKRRAFPSPAAVAALDEEDLRRLGFGFRAPYLIAAARMIDSGALNLETLRTLPIEDARRALTSIPGVGPKVADCTLLYGLSRMEAFPVDVWIGRALNAYFPEGADLTPYAGAEGIVQQYIFYYVRKNPALVLT